MRIVTSAQMKQIEQNSLAYDLTFHRLMENAGSAAAAFIRRTMSVRGRNCMIFCAKGNNGGDGLVVARKLSEDGANVVIVMLDGIPGSQEAAAMYQTVQMMELPMVDFSSERRKVTDFLEQTDLVVDAICGTGFTGSLKELHRNACQAINNAIAAVISLDIPTGVECDTGKADPDAIHADFTVAFDSRKPAHVLPAAQPYCGTVEVVDIGIPEEAHENIGPDFDIFAAQAQPEEDVPVTFEHFGADPAASPAVEEDLAFSFGAFVEEDTADEEFVFTPVVEEPVPPPAPAEDPVTTITTQWVMEQLKPRPADCHKGDFGRLLNISGCQNYRGAAVLSTLAALRSGAGLVTLASTRDVCATAASHVLEATYLPLAASAVGGIDYEGAAPAMKTILGECSAVVMGCGLGRTVHTAQLVQLVLEQADCPIVVDADGINALAQNIHVLQKASATVVLTPHAGEMARLCGVETDEITRDRQGFAARFAREHDVIVVLKGMGTLVASPDDGLLLCETGNPGLAKGGSGDVLAGMIGAFLAQGIPPREAAACAVHLHGLAGDRCAGRLGQYAMLPSELLQDLAAILLEQGR